MPMHGYSGSVAATNAPCPWLRGSYRDDRVYVQLAIEVLTCDGIDPDLHGAAPNTLNAQTVLENLSIDS